MRKADLILAKNVAKNLLSEFLRSRLPQYFQVAYGWLDVCEASPVRTAVKKGACAEQEDSSGLLT
jgi:hypothetical protein